jgi:hypothetical protein
MHLPAGLSTHCFERLQEPFPVQIVTKNFFAPITPVHQVINGVLILNTQLPRHRQLLMQIGTCVNSED